MDIINTVIGIPLGYVMYFCMLLVKNYGLAIIIFTLISKIVLLPLSLWVQKNSIKMVKLQPELNELNAKYIFDKDKFYDAQIDLYKREKYHTFAGILPLLIQIPLILGVINVIYNPMQHLLHMDHTVIAAFQEKAEMILEEELGSSAQLRIIDLINSDECVGEFLALSEALPGVDLQKAVNEIRALDMKFLSLDLTEVPLPGFSILWIIPILSGLSSWIMCYLQNKVNVLQIEQGFMGKWGMAIFLTLFSLYFAFVVSAGVGLYWIASNVFAIAQMYLMNAIYNPKKYIDYERLEASKITLAKAKEQVPKKSHKLFDNSPEHKKEKEDYKRFFKVSEDDMKIVFYSEGSGFYKYYKDFIEEILATSGYNIHYVTSDFNDAVFKMNNSRIIPYYIGETKLISLMMKITADVVVMTMPDLQNFHIKRSLVRDDVKYVYALHGPDSINLTMRKGSVDHYDIILCAGSQMVEEIRETEKVYGLPKKKLIKCGYPLIDDMIAAYESEEHTENPIKTILIAPSWQPDNIIDSCIDEILSNLQSSGCKIIVRPHPQHIRHRKEYIESLKEKYSCGGSPIEFQLDFSSNSTVFNADLLITDWSGIAFEYSFATKRPSLFINTPMKIMNEEYQKISAVPTTLTWRSVVGTSLDTDKIGEINEKVHELLTHEKEYAEKINKCLEEDLYHVGESGKVGARIILKQVKQ